MYLALKLGKDIGGSCYGTNFVQNILQGLEKWLSL